jgi:dTDP-4-dehydrorhamnose reductase
MEPIFLHEEGVASMRMLITGAGGMLGHQLSRTARAQGITVTAPDRAALDVTDYPALEVAVEGHDVVVNAAAWTDVDGAESHEEAAAAVNGVGPANVAVACARAGAALIQVSTDYVFGGRSPSPYYEHDATAPVNAYGRGKLAGETAVLKALPEAAYIVRTAWLYGAHGSCFARKILQLADTREYLSVVDDQWGQPTWTGALAIQLVQLARAANRGDVPAGIYHGTSTGRTSWYGFARALFEATGRDPARIRPVASTGFPRPALRPVSGVLAHSAWAFAGIALQPSWRKQLRAALAAGELATTGHDGG